MSPYEPAAENTFAHQAVSYLVAGDGTILWHPDFSQVGKTTDIGPLLAGPLDAPGAIVTRVGGDQSVVGFAPLNLGRLVPRARIDSQWVQWNVVTQEKWANIIAPLNSLWLGLLAIAFILFLISLLLVVRTANTLTRPVASLVVAARSLSAGNLRQRLDVSGPSEIEELSHQFNDMADRLAASYEDLEGRVAGRTAELATANAELQRSLLESQTVQAVAANIAGTAGLDEILRQIASSTADAVGSESAIVFLPVEGDSTKLCVAAVWNMPQVATGTIIPVDRSLSGLAFTSGKPQVSEDAQNDYRLFKQTDGAEGISSILSVPLSSHGEITGALNAINKRGGRFNDNDLRLLKLLADQTAVAIERAQLYSDTKRQVHALRTINDLALSVTLSQSVEKTLTAGMERIGNLTETSGSVVYLFDDRSHILNLTASYGLSPRHLDMLKSVAPNIQVGQQPDITIAVLEAFNRQQPYAVEETGTESFMSGWWRSYEEINPEAADHHDEITLGALIALPLSVRDKRLGTLTIYFAQPRKFDADEVQMYQSLAQILGLALYNTQLFAQSSKLATVEERARLARELHDSVTQSLFSLNLTLRAARRVLERDPSSAMQLLDNVHELAQGSLAEMRALIFELRPQALENEGLTSALQKHADAVRARSGLKVHLKVTGERRLPIAHEEALYQIAREALHNVVKHARAGEAWIDLDLSGNDVLLSIRDNGRGFDLPTLRQGGGSHIGTSTMQERARAINGHLEIESASAKGTRVSVRVHIPEAELTETDLQLPADSETGDRTTDESLQEKLSV